MSFTGRQLTQIIKLAGLEGQTRSEIAALFRERGFSVPQGSLSRALSRARGTWSSDQIFGNAEGVFYERGSRLSSLPDATRTYANPNGELVGGGDVLAEWGGQLGIPLEDAYFLASSGGVEWSKETRGAIERSLKYIYEVYGVTGQDALDLLGDEINKMQDIIEDSPSLWEISVIEMGTMGVDAAISYVYSL